ncbi:MAG TPA: flagellar biosynthetic protein FliP [Opitutae bacterium]|nr:flagellar biosynthetic protein FliP [Opitutae bacterium]
MLYYPKFLLRLTFFAGLILCFTSVVAYGQSSGATPINFTLNVGAGEGGDVSVAIQLLFVMTILTLAPSIIILMTSFTRIVIVLGFVRNALGVQQAPSNQIIIGLALFLTFFLMGPLWGNIYSKAVVPYMDGSATSTQALDVGGSYLKSFMLKQTRSGDIEFFLGLAGMGPTDVEEVPFRVVVPAFILSELRTAFQMGFLIFIPFIVIDFIVASTLMAMGMMMMPPVIISLPFKLLLFVLVDGWYLVVRSLVQSFNL